MMKRNWAKKIALAVVLLLGLSLLAGCQSGRNYSDELAGDSSKIPVTYKEQTITVPYVGKRPVETVYTKNPIEVGLVDADGYLLDGTGRRIDLSDPSGSSYVNNNQPNTNTGNTGNTGNTNVGDTNNGNTNIGDTNTGDTNTGDTNTGDTNTGDTNTGDTNTGDTNTGDTNTGDTNTGDTNTGDTNTGDTNTGDTNTGDTNGGEGETDAMAADESGTKVRLMSQNVRYNNAEDATDANKAASVRIYRLKKLVEKNDPDIIATQECDAFWVEGLPQTFGDTYSMSYEYRQASKGSDEACAVLYKTAKYDLTDSGTFWLSETPDSPDPAGFDQYYPRIAHWVELKDKETGVKLLVFSTHFGFGYTTDQMAYIRGLFAKVCADHPDAYPFIMGDFNISYGSENFLVLNDYNDMIDLREVAMEMKSAGYCEMGDIRNGTSGAFTSDKGSSIIDFIFAQPRKKQAVDYYTFLYDRIAVEEQSIPEGPVSDHFAVLADVRVNTDISYGEFYGDNAK